MRPATRLLSRSTEGLSRGYYLGRSVVLEIVVAVWAATISLCAGMFNSLKCERPAQSDGAEVLTQVQQLLILLRPGAVSPMHTELFGELKNTRL